MKNEQILKRAVEKAIENGWKKKLDYVCYDGAGFIDKKNEDGIEVLSIYEIIFSHDFAKHFWGKKRIPRIDANGVPMGYILLWKVHLQQMVLKKDPIKYLGKYL